MTPEFSPELNLQKETNFGEYFQRVKTIATMLELPPEIYYGSKVLKEGVPDEASEFLLNGKAHHLGESNFYNRFFRPIFLYGEVDRQSVSLGLRRGKKGVAYGLIIAEENIVLPKCFLQKEVNRKWTNIITFEKLSLNDLEILILFGEWATGQSKKPTGLPQFLAEKLLAMGGN